MKPCKLNEIEEYPLDDEMLLYSSNKAIGVSLNGSAMDIWKLCNGNYTVIEITQQLGQRYGVSSEELLDELLEDVKATVNQFISLGLLEVSGVSKTTPA